jgi:hypothetical protein
MHANKIDKLESALSAHVRGRVAPEAPGFFAASVLRQVRAAEWDKKAQTLMSRAFAPFLAVAAVTAIMLVTATVLDHSWSDILLFSKINYTSQSAPNLWFLG